MHYNANMSPNEQVCEVLLFMERHVSHRPLTRAEIESTRHGWNDLSASEKVMRWQRCLRRFTAVHPTLASKDRVRHASEMVHYIQRSEAGLH